MGSRQAAGPPGPPGRAPINCASSALLALLGCGVSQAPWCRIYPSDGGDQLNARRGANSQSQRTVTAPSSRHRYLFLPWTLAPRGWGFLSCARSRWSTPLPAPMPTMPPSLCPSQAHLPGSISGSRSVIGYGDREGAGKVPGGGRNQRECGEVRDQSKGEGLRWTPGAHLLQRKGPLCK